MYPSLQQYEIFMTFQRIMSYAGNKKARFVFRNGPEACSCGMTFGHAAAAFTASRDTGRPA